MIFAQSDRGTITGTVSDPTGGLLAGAMVQARNVATGAQYQAVTTSTGNYTIPEVPTGMYQLSVTSPGFKQFTRSGITVPAAQTVRLDVALEIGAATESVTVQADASMLKTENADVSHNVNVQTLNELPMLGVGSSQAGSSGIRNPNNVLQQVPGTYYVPNSQVKINGALTNTEGYHVEGMDATNLGFPYAAAQTQPSVDAIQEVSVQTSNFAPEFGWAGGGFFNVTMKSGTNEFHGTAYDYFVNEVFNAGTPFTDDGHGNHLRPPARRNDYGFTFGGPVWIPRLYNGRDRTFFFFNFEQFRETQHINNVPITVPTLAYRTGNFNGAIAAANNKLLTTDQCGTPIYQNEIFDPRTAHLCGNQMSENPFSNNTIPPELIDPVAQNIQNLIPAPTLAAALNNYLPNYPSTRHTTIPAVKADQILGPNAKLSFYWSFTHTDSAFSPTYGQSEGLPIPITATRGTFIHSHAERLNYDQTVTPALLLHLGAGYQQNNFFDDAPALNFDPATIGLQGTTVKRNFPVIQGLCPPAGIAGVACPAAGGMYNMGPVAGQSHQYWEKPEANASLTWVKGNHTIKGGGEFYLEGVPIFIWSNTAGNFTFSPNQTAPPYLVGSSGQQNVPGGTAGFAYASFLLGAVDNFSIAPLTETRQGKNQWGLFLQDSWKVTRAFTVTYGVRWDYGTYFREQYGRSTDFSPTTPNPNAGGYPGAWIYEGGLPGHCQCSFASNYPYAIAPRVGIAYQITRKTVIRAGWGLLYNQTGTNNLGISTAGVASVRTISSPSPGQPATFLRAGIPSQVVPPFPNTDPGYLPLPGTVALNLPPGLGFFDPNAGRPARQNQWSIGVEHEWFRDLVVEASYVGNEGVWWPAPALVNLNAIRPETLAAKGINLSDSADQMLLTSPLNSAAGLGRGFTAPYAGFPLTQTVAQSLRPFPQFGNIPAIGDPRGKTWYDALQAKVNKRLSRGIYLSAAFTWQKSLQEGVDTNANGPGGAPLVNNILSNLSNAKSISSFDQPFLFQVTASYQLPHRFPGPRAASWALGDWRVGTLLIYGSGLPIPVPAATTSLNNQIFQPTLANRVANQPLYGVPSLNCHCFDPYNTFVLNQDAWTNPVPGQFGSSAEFYSDFRYQRHPQENMNLGRTFRFTERVSLDLRIEFNNVFNRLYLNNPSVSLLAPRSRVNANDPKSQVTGGFGYVNLATTGTQFGQPRNGFIVGRLMF